MQERRGPGEDKRKPIRGNQPPGGPPQGGRPVEGAGEYPTPKKVVPVTLGAARTAIASFIESDQDPTIAHYDTSPSASTFVIPENFTSFLLETQRGSDLFGTLGTYYPGPILDCMFINRVRYENILNEYATRKADIPYEDFKAALDERLDNHEFPRRYYAYLAGMETYSKALWNTSRELGASLPPIPDSLLDAYDRDLIDPLMAQEEKTRRDELKAMFIHKTDQTKDGVAFVLSPFGRFRIDQKVSGAIDRAINERGDYMGDVDENFVTAITENPPVSEDHLPHFLTGARVIYDIFALAHEIEEIRTILGEPIDRQKESVTPSEARGKEDSFSLDELFRNEGDY